MEAEVVHGPEIKAIMAQYMLLEEVPDDEEIGGASCGTMSRPGSGRRRGVLNHRSLDDDLRNVWRM